jgi:hypothetical protein
MTNWLVSGMTMLTRSGVEHGRLVVPVRHHVVVGSVVCTARAEHEGVHAHAYVVTLRFDALVDEHARAFLAVDPARFWADLVRCNERNINHAELQRSRVETSHLWNYGLMESKSVSCDENI